MSIDQYAERIRSLSDRLERIYKRRERDAWIAGLCIGFLLGIALADYL